MASRSRRVGLLLAALAAAGCFNAKPDDIAGGGGVETTEGNLAGGTGLVGPVGARVSLIPADFDPLRDTLPDSLTVLADADGKYRFRGLAPGRYNLEAHLPATGTRCFRPGVVIAKGDRRIPETDTLAAPGRLRLSWDGVRRGVLAQRGRLFRLDLADLQPDSGGITLDSLPAGLLPPITYIAAADSAPRLLTDSVRIAPGKLDSIPVFGEWAHSAILNWSVPSMPSMPPEDLEGYPLLVRLTAPDFPFGEAPRGGSDIRFTTMAGDPLPHAVESWDGAAGRAEVWVRLKAQPGGGLGSLRMDWGSASPASPKGPVFDSLSGFAGVWHLAQEAENGAGPLEDAGPFGLSTHSLGLMPEYMGAIGIAQRFDGAGAYAHATAKAQVQRPSQLLLSAWIVPDTAGMPAKLLGYPWTILSKWDETDSTGFILSYTPGPKRVRLTLGFGTKVSHVEAVMPENTLALWHHVVAAYDGTEADIWWDGRVIATSRAGPGNLPPNNRDILIGARPAADTAVGPAEFFRGHIDEARVHLALPSKAWVELDYQTQKPGAGIMSFQRLK